MGRPPRRHAPSRLSSPQLRLAVVSLANAITIDIPLLATFQGFVDSTGSHLVTVDRSWVAVLVLTLGLAAPLPIVAITRHRERP